MYAEDYADQSVPEAYFPQTHSPAPAMMSDSLVQWQLDPEQIKEDIVHQLKGEVFDYKDKKWIRQGNPLLNEKGVNGIATILLSVINRNILLSSLDDEDIRKFVIEVANNLTDDLTVNYEEYGIGENFPVLDHVIDLVKINVFAALSRAKAGSDGIGATQKFLTTTQRFHETSVVNNQSPARNQQNNRSSFWNAFSFLGRR